MSDAEVSIIPMRFYVKYTLIILSHEWPGYYQTSPAEDKNAVTFKQLRIVEKGIARRALPF